MHHAIGNLDCEQDFAKTLATANAHSPGTISSRKVILPSTAPSLQLRLSSLATLLRVFFDSDFTLWTYCDVDPKKVADHSMFPKPSQILLLPKKMTEPFPKQAVYWGQGTNWAVRPSTMPLHQRFQGQCSIETAVRCHDKRFAFGLRQNVGAVIANSAIVDSMELLHKMVAVSQQTVVIKSPISASGRARILSSHTLTNKQNNQAETWLEYFGSVIVEPWQNRTSDFAVCGYIDKQKKFHLYKPHRLINSPRGIFQAIVTTPPSLPETVLTEQNTIANALASNGYQGPFSIDGYCYHKQDGEQVWQPLSEINARLTMGHVAHAIADRVNSPIEFRIAKQMPNTTFTTLLSSTPADPTWAGYHTL